MIIYRISLAGIDNNVSIDELLTLIDEFPQVEVGICLSKVSMGKPRYPTLDYITKLAANGRITLSAHICGQWMKDLLLGCVTIKEDLDTVWNKFSRVQFNYVDYFTNQEKVPGNFHKKAEAFMEALEDDCFKGKGLIFPLNPNSNEFLEKYIHLHKVVQVLHDASMGFGKVPDVWPAPFHTLFTGYAGGLTPDNLAEQLILIEKSINNPKTATWIDAESGLRSGDNQFDMAKARRFCEIATNYETN